MSAILSETREMLEPVTTPGESVVRRAPAHLAMVHAPGDGPPEAAVVLDARVVVGRVHRGEVRPDVDLALADSRVSRRHATFRHGALGFQLRDDHSRNGTYVNGAPVTAGGWCTLRSGDVVRIGDTLMVYRHGLPPDTPAFDHPLLPGRSPAMNELRWLVRCAASLRVPLLVQGERGAGKSRVVRALCSLGAEPQAEPVAIACGSLSQTADADAPTFEALLERPTAGIVWLSEVGHLHLELQAALTRVLELSQRGRGPRIVATTSVDLHRAVTTARFRPDLLARLTGALPALRVPALRERIEDLPGWIAHLQVELALEPEARARPVTPTYLEAMMLGEWPSNLPELRAAVATAMQVDALDHALTPEDLPLPLRARHRAARDARHGRPPVREVRSRSASTPNRERILEELGACHGNMRRAAERLRVDRRKLYRLCETLGIDYGGLRRGSSSGQP